MTALIAEGASYASAAIGFDTDNLLFASNESDSAMTPIFCSRPIAQAVVSYLAVYSELTTKLFQVFRCIDTLHFVPRIVAVCGRMKDSDVEDMKPFRCLQYVRLYDCISKSDCLKTFGRNQPLLKKLELSSCTFDDFGVESLVQNIPCMEHLDISENPNLTNQSMIYLTARKRSGLKFALKSLSIANCEGIDYRGLVYLKYLDDILTLDISGNKFLSIEVLDCLPKNCGKLIMANCASALRTEDHKLYRRFMIDGFINRFNAMGAGRAGDYSGFCLNHFMYRHPPELSAEERQYPMVGPLERPPYIWHDCPVDMKDSINADYGDDHKLTEAALRRLKQEALEQQCRKNDDDDGNDGAPFIKNDDTEDDHHDPAFDPLHPKYPTCFTLLERIARRLPYLMELNASNTLEPSFIPKYDQLEALEEFCPHMQLLDITGLQLKQDVQDDRMAAAAAVAAKQRPAEAFPFRMRTFCNALPFTVYHKYAVDKEELRKEEAAKRRKIAAAAKSHDEEDEESNPFSLF